ncbi:MAG: sigma-70 family RNA polymerase sigma factor [Ruminococcaceae bacterium]|nr:sigma-70 family RNA polymerase sigma factor [Oscillospiraceae bacterium]
MDETLAECLDFVRAGDQGAFNRLAQQYQPLILSQIESFLGSMPPDTMGRDDLLQEANIAFYSAAIKYDTKQSKVTFGLFAKICIRNRLVSALRKQRRYAQKNKVAKITAVPAEQITPCQEDLEEQFSELLTRYEKQVLKLRLENYSYKEIAQKLKSDPKSIDNALYRIRQKIRTAQSKTE